MRLILLLVVLFGCFYFNEAKHTVFVENIYPNYNDWVVINDFAVDDFTITTFNVGTLNVNSADGVNIITSNSITLYGASVNVGGSTVSVSANSPDSVINIDAASTLDILGASATFSSQLGDVILAAYADFELISTGDLAGQYSGSFSIEGIIAEFQASKGGAHFLTHSSFVSQATTTFSDAGNLILFNTTDFEVRANLAIDVFTGEFYGDVDSFTLVARRNNILLQTGNILDIGGDSVNINALDLFTITSLESQVLLSAAFEGSFNAFDEFRIFSDSEVTFSAANGDLFVSVVDDASLFANEGVAFQSTSPALDTFGIRSINLTVTGESIVTETTNADITHDTESFTSNTFGTETIYAQRDLYFNAASDITFEVDASIDIHSNRGDLTFFSANSSGVGISLDTTFHTVLSGTSVSIVPETLTLNAKNNLRFATNEENRDSQLLVDATTSFITSPLIDFPNSNLFFVTGGEVEIDASVLDLRSETDITFTATGFPSSFIDFGTFNQSETADNDIAYNGGQFIVSASDNTHFTTDTFNLNTQDNFVLAAGNDVNFNVRSNMTIDTTLDAKYFTSGDIQIGVSILEQTQIDAGYVQALSSGAITTEATANVTIVGTNVNFDVDERLTTETDLFVAAAGRFLVLSGDQQYSYPEVLFTSQNTLLQSLPDQDITLNGDTLNVQGNTNFVGRTFSSQADSDILFDLGSTFSIITNEEAPIHIGAGNDPDVTFTSAGLSIETSHDMSITSDTSANFFSSSYENNAEHEISHTVYDHFGVTTNFFQISSSILQFYSVGKTTLSVADSLTVSSANNILSLLSTKGGITLDSGGNLNLQTQSLEVDATNTNTFDAGQTMTLDSTNIQIKGDLNVQADQEVDYTATGDLVFFGSEFDIVSFGSLFLSSENELTMDSTVITVISEDALTLSTDAEVSLNAGLDKDLTFYQGSEEGTFSIQGDNLRVQSNNILDISSNAIIQLSADGTDEFGNSILFQTSAMSAGISVNAGDFFSTSTSNHLFFVDDITNRGGDDINLTGTTSAIFSVDSTTFLPGGNPVNPVPSLDNSLTSGVYFYASGSENDPILGYPTGILYRTEGKKAPSNNEGTIQINAQVSAYFNSEVYNEFISHDSTVSFAARNGEIVFTVGGDLGIESDRSSAIYSSSDDTVITVAETAQIQSSSFTHSHSDLGTFLSASGAFEAIADRGGVFFDLVGSSNSMTTKATSINLEGGLNGLFQYDSDTYTATAISLYTFSTAAFIGTTESVDATHNMYYESSINNDISITSKASTSVTATTGNIQLDAGLDTSFTANTDSTFAAIVGDVNFFSAGSFQYVAEESLNVLSVANQIYVAKARAYIESEGTVNIGDGIASTPIVTIYAGGDTLRNGVELRAIQDFTFTTENDNNIQGRNWYSTSEFTTDVVTDGSMTLQSTGTNGIGKDVTFTAGESLDLFSQQNLNLNAKTLKFEYENLDFSTSSDFLLTAVKGISISGSTFSTDSVTHTLSSKTGISITADSDVLFDAKTTLSFTSKTTANWKSLSQTTISAGENLLVTSTGTNSPISFTTSNDRSHIELQAQENVNINSGENIEYFAVKGFQSLINGDATFNIGDSVTANAGGDIIISGSDIINLSANSGASTGSDFQFTSAGTIHAEIGTDFLVNVGRDLFIQPDIDLTFEGGRIDNDQNNNLFSFVITNQIALSTGNNFNFNVGERTLFSAATYDSVALGVNPEDGNGILLSTSGEFSDIEVTAGSGSVLTSAIGNINITSENAVTLRSAGTLQLLSKGKEGITFSTNELPTPILVVSRNGLDLVGHDQVILQSYGVDSASGYIDIRATGYANLGEVNPLINGTFGIGFFAEKSDITVNAAESIFRMDELHHFIATPNVNGSLLLQAHGQDVEGVGIRIESTIVTAFSELDVAFEANNIHFFDLGTSEYNYDYGYIFPTNAFLNRPTIQSQKDQTYVAYGHNDKGNAIELLTSVPNSPLLFRTGYINYYSGGSLLVKGEENTYISTTVETAIVSATSVVLQGDGLNAEIGIYLTTRVLDGDSHIYFPNTPTQLGSNIEFNSKIDSYILTADRIIDNAQQLLYFVTGPTGTINLTFDEGASFESSDGDLEVNADDIDFFSNGEISLISDTFTATTTTSTTLTAVGLSDGSGNIIWGNPQETPQVGTPDINLSATGDINFFSNYLDIANTNNLEIQKIVGAPGTVALNCNAANRGQIYFISDVAYEYLCFCTSEVAGFTTTPTFETGTVCYAFFDKFG